VLTAADNAGVGVDLSHCSSKAKVSAHGKDALVQALTGCNLVVIPAGVPRKPGMTRDDLFNINAGIVKNICQNIASVCPDAWVAIITNPVNSTVPVAAEVFKAQGCFNPATLFGVTTLDVVRAKTFIAEILNVDPSEVW
jgi:malate/lactate dehydrogenase